jgi:hypothetical protein
MQTQLTVGQAAQLLGIPTAILRTMCTEGSVPATRGPAGHWYLDADDLPTYDEVRQHFLQQYTDALARAKAIAARVQKELEAIELDIVEATEDETRTEPLGNDILSAGNASGAFNTALADLRYATTSVSILHRALRQIEAKRAT